MLAHMDYPPVHHQLPVKAKQKSIKASSKSKSQPAQSQPVDAEELSRRLAIVLAEQRERSDRKRRATTEAASKVKQHSLNGRSNRDVDHTVSSGVSRTRTEIGIKHKAKPASSHEEAPLAHLIPEKTSTSMAQDGQCELGNKPTYRHVPKVAASQFTRTTSTEPASQKGPIHALSRQAMKFHLDGPNASPTVRANDPYAPPCEKNKALMRAQSMRERHYRRNPIDKPSLPVTSKLDMTLYPLGPYHIHQSYTKPDKAVDDESRQERRMSTGSILGRSETHPAEPLESTAMFFFSTEKPDIVGNPNDHRVDWTQSDERTTANVVVQPVPTKPELRKTESKWKLKSRLGSFGRHSKDDKLVTPPEELAALDASPKLPITGFRF